MPKFQWNIYLIRIFENWYVFVARVRTHGGTIGNDTCNIYIIFYINWFKVKYGYYLIELHIYN